MLDTTSAGILLYTGLVELLAREFCFSEEVEGEEGGEVTWMVVGFWLVRRLWRVWGSGLEVRCFG